MITSVLTGKQVQDPEEVHQEWMRAFRLWYAYLIIARAEVPSTLSETNNCVRCQGTAVFHHCLYEKCATTDRTEECLHPNEGEWAEFQQIVKKYLPIMNEAVLAKRIGHQSTQFLSDLFKDPLAKFDGRMGTSPNPLARYPMPMIFDDEKK